MLGFGIEDVLETVKEACAIQFYGAKNLESVSLAGSRYFWLRTYPRPCAVECGVLPEARFVFVKDGCPFVFGFFLMLGYLYRIQRSCAALSACASIFLGRWTENPRS